MHSSSLYQEERYLWWGTESDYLFGWYVFLTSVVKETCWL